MSVLDRAIFASHGSPRQPSTRRTLVQAAAEIPGQRAEQPPATIFGDLVNREPSTCNLCVRMPFPRSNHLATPRLREITALSGKFITRKDGCAPARDLFLSSGGSACP